MRLLLQLFRHIGHNTAEGGLSSLKTPGIAANPDALIEELVDLATQVLRVEDKMWEERNVHHLIIFGGEDLRQRPAQHYLRLSCQIRSQGANNGVHRMVHRTSINTKPGNTTIKDPIGKLAGRARMFDKIAGLIRQAFAGPVAGIIFMVPGMDEKNIASLDLDTGATLPFLKMLRRIEFVIANAHLFQINNNGGAKELIERNTTDILPIGHKVEGGIEMGAHVQRRGDMLATDFVEREPFNPLDGGTFVGGKARCMGIPVLGEVEDAHMA